MFKKLITLMLAVAFTTTSVFADTNSGLKAAFNELNFSLTVEWDQKDKAFYDAKMNQFQTKLKELQAKGLTNAQMLEFAKSEVKDARIARDIETAFNMIQIQKMSRSDAAEYMTQTMKKSYATGASWNGEAFLYVGLAVLLVAVALAGAAAGYSGNGGGYNGGYCEEVYVCDTYCYNDYYWGRICEDDCFYDCY